MGLREWRTTFVTLRALGRKRGTLPRSIGASIRMSGKNPGAVRLCGQSASDIAFFATKTTLFFPTGPITHLMGVLACCGSIGSSFRALSRAAAKSAAAKLRLAGMLPVRVDWARRAEICERCPLRVVRKGISYCGNPFLQQLDRDPSIEGCGCPTRDKAKSPSEHCPLTRQNRAARQAPEPCDCKWCTG